MSDIHFPPYAFGHFPHLTIFKTTKQRVIPPSLIHHGIAREDQEQISRTCTTVSVSDELKQQSGDSPPLHPTKKVQPWGRRWGVGRWASSPGEAQQSHTALRSPGQNNHQAPDTRPVRGALDGQPPWTTASGSRQSTAQKGRPRDGLPVSPLRPLRQKVLEAL